MATTPRVLPSTYLDRRRKTTPAKLRRVGWSFIADMDLDTMERLLWVFLMSLSIGVFWFAKAIIAQPPPLFRGLIVIPPAWLWTLLIWVGVAWQYSGRARFPVDFCRRRNGAIFTLVVVCMLLGPLFLRAPFAASIVCVLAVLQALFTAQMIYLCEKDKVANRS